MKRDLTDLYASRKGHLDRRIARDYMRNGVAVIPCRISCYNDVISPYSVKGCEAVEPGFTEYLNESVEAIPDEAPLVINIVGDMLTQDEKNTISEVIRDEAAYRLGMAEKEQWRHKKIFLCMCLGLLLSGVLLWLTTSLDDIPREMFFILFWFAGDTVCDYLFSMGFELRRERRLAGRIASVKVVFSDKYEDRKYTDSDVEALYSEIEKDVDETIRD